MDFYNNNYTNETNNIEYILEKKLNNFSKKQNKLIKDYIDVKYGLTFFFIYFILGCFFSFFAIFAIYSKNIMQLLLTIFLYIMTICIINTIFADKSNSLKKALKTNKYNLYITTCIDKRTIRIRRRHDHDIIDYMFDYNFKIKARTEHTSFPIYSDLKVNDNLFIIEYGPNENDFKVFTQQELNKIFSN